VSWTLVHADGTAAEGVDLAEVEARLASGEHFWLDVGQPEGDDLAVLAEKFDLHRLARDDLGAFGQRPKADDYPGHTLIVLFGATHDEDSIVEVHAVVSESWLLTAHTESCPAFIGLRKRTMLGGPLPATDVLMNKIADSLADSFYPELERIDDRIDELEHLVLSDDQENVLAEVLGLRRHLVLMRRVLGPQRDLVARLATGAVELPGADEETRFGFRAAQDELFRVTELIDAQRDLVARLATGAVELPGADEETRFGFRAAQDELFRVTELIDAQRDLLTGALEVHLSTVSNRLNEVMRRLAAVATIFLPITFLSGFFGQNFAYMVKHVDGATAFVLGTLLQLAVAVGVVAILHLRRWI
jgi:magnesium transporter